MLPLTATVVLPFVFRAPPVLSNRRINILHTSTFSSILWAHTYFGGASINTSLVYTMCLEAVFLFSSLCLLQTYRFILGHPTSLSVTCIIDISLCQPMLSIPNGSSFSAFHGRLDFPIDSICQSSKHLQDHVPFISYIILVFLPILSPWPWHRGIVSPFDFCLFMLPNHPFPYPVPSSIIESKSSLSVLPCGSTDVPPLPLALNAPLRYYICYLFHRRSFILHIFQSYILKFSSRGIGVLHSRFKNKYRCEL